MTGLAGVPAVDVVVPTYRRPDDLARCLSALDRQTHVPARVIIVVRGGDAESRAVVTGFRAEVVGVEAAGVVAAMTAGVLVSSAPLVAITDDDAEPRPDWLAGLVAHLHDPGVGAAGGRDVVEGDDETSDVEVGRVAWWGRHQGNHHRGRGRTRDVDALKGVSMLMRAEALAFPAPGVLRGSGAEVHWELVTCAHVRSLGLRLVYDPTVLVDHRPGLRHDGDRTRPSRQAVMNATYNLVLGTSARIPVLRPIHASAGLAVGCRDAPGMLRVLSALVRREPDVTWRLWPATRGRLLAVARMGVRAVPLVRPRALAAID